MIRLEFELARSSKKSQSLKTGNEMINANDRMHYIVKGAITKHLRELAHTTASRVITDGTTYNQDKPCNVVIRVSPPTKRRMDAPNWYPTVKALMDGLTDFGLFSDDDDSVVTSMTFVRDVQSKDKRYKITIDIYDGNIHT